MVKTKTADAVKGRWRYVLGELAPELREAIAKVGKHVPCPVHGGRDGFRLFKDFDDTGGGVCNTCGKFSDGWRLLFWLKGWDFAAAACEIDRVLGNQAAVSGEAVRTLKAVSFGEQEDTAKRQRALRDLWARATSPDVALAYLRRRGIPMNELPSEVRGIKGLSWSHVGAVPGIYPAMLARVRGADGRAVTVHRIYDADVDPRKKMMPPAGEVSGGAARLFAPGAELGVAEGIETALAAAYKFGLPVWACLNASMLAKVAIPAGVRRVIVFGDNDHAGRMAAYELAIRLEKEDRVARVALPKTEGADWLDVLNGEAR